MMTEANGFRVSALLTADADFQIGIGFATPLDRDLHQSADTFHIQHLERIVLQDVGFFIQGQELVLRIFA